MLLSSYITTTKGAVMPRNSRRARPRRQSNFNPDSLQQELHANQQRAKKSGAESKRPKKQKTEAPLADWELKLLEETRASMHRTGGSDERPVTFMPTETDLMMRQMDAHDSGWTRPEGGFFAHELGLEQ